MSGELGHTREPSLMYGDPSPHVRRAQSHVRRVQSHVRRVQSHVRRVVSARQSAARRPSSHQNMPRQRWTRPRPARPPTRPAQGRPLECTCTACSAPHGAAADGLAQLGGRLHSAEPAVGTGRPAALGRSHRALGGQVPGGRQSRQ